MEIRRMHGEAAARVGRFFGLAGGWGVMLWDVPSAERREALPGARTGVAHFCSLGGPEALAAGRAFLEHRELTARYDALLGVIPAPYRHARRFVRELGFSEKLIPGLCRLPERRRPVPGALVVKVL